MTAYISYPDKPYIEGEEDTMNDRMGELTSKTEIVEEIAGVLGDDSYRYDLDAVADEAYSLVTDRDDETGAQIGNPYYKRTLSEEGFWEAVQRHDLIAQLADGFTALSMRILPDGANKAMVERLWGRLSQDVEYLRKGQHVYYLNCAALAKDWVFWLLNGMGRERPSCDAEAWALAGRVMSVAGQIDGNLGIDKLGELSETDSFAGEVPGRDSGSDSLALRAIRTSVGDVFEEVARLIDPSGLDRHKTA